MVQHEIAATVAREWCDLYGRPDQQQAVANVLETERTKIAFNQLLEDIRKKAVFLPHKRKSQLNRLIDRILYETALKFKNNAKNES